MGREFQIGAAGARPAGFRGPILAPLAKICHGPPFSHKIIHFFPKIVQIAGTLPFDDPLVDYIGSFIR